MTDRGEFNDTEPARRTTERPRERLGPIATAVSLFVALGTLIFTAGYNWRGLEEVRIAQQRTHAMVVSDYVRKDVDQQQQATVEAKLDEIKAQLAVLQRAIERQGR